MGIPFRDHASVADVTTPALHRFERRSLAARAVRPVARLISAFVEPIFYWLGLLDASGHPDNSKLMYTAASVGADVMVIIMGIQIVQTGKEVTWPFVALVMGVLLFGAGVRYVMKALRWKFGGNGDKPESPATPP